MMQDHYLPVSIYDFELSSADGKEKNVFSEAKGKVNLVFNVAAGCGNIPQHYVLEELRKQYAKETNFSIIAVVVDDFVCHGYPEFQNGLMSYIEKNSLQLTPGEVAEKYAKENFGVGYKFTELTNGRFDKHTYEETFVPGENKIQEINPFWAAITGSDEADVNENGIPYHYEDIPWTTVKAPPIPAGKKGFKPLTGNFEKFLFDRTGTKFKRFSNGFLLGERDPFGETFPWFPEKYTESGQRDYRPVREGENGFKFSEVSSVEINPEALKLGSDWTFSGNDPHASESGWPSPLQKHGIKFSLDLICADIDEYLNS